MGKFTTQIVSLLDVLRRDPKHQLEKSKQLENAATAATALRAGGSQAYMLNMRREAYNTGFYSYLACFMNTVTLNMNMFPSNKTGFIRWNMVFIFLWLRPSNT